MSYVRNDSLMYQMPVHFGPCVTPRQNKEGNRFIYDQATRLTKHTIVYESDPEALSAVLPQRFELAAPYVIINMNMLRDVACWLDTDTTLPASLCPPVSMEKRGWWKATCFWLCGKTMPTPLLPAGSSSVTARYLPPSTTSIRTGGYQRRS